MEAMDRRELNDKVLLAVQAHPDDEIGIASLLAHYSNLGVRVHLISLSPGQEGFREHTDFRDENALKQDRKREIEKAAEILGVSRLTVWDFRDRGIFEDYERIRESPAGELQRSHRTRSSPSARRGSPGIPSIGRPAALLQKSSRLCWPLARCSCITPCRIRSDLRMRVKKPDGNRGRTTSIPSGTIEIPQVSRFPNFPSAPKICLWTGERRRPRDVFACFSGRDC